MQMLARTLSVCAALTGVAGVTVSDAATAATDYYKGKRINLIVGYPVGGGYDTYSRLLGKHMTDHIPGNPRIIVKNMGGAGSLKAASYIANVAPKDGTVFGTFSRALALTKRLGTVKMDFDPFELTYLGSLSSFKNDAYMILVGEKSRYKTVKDLQDQGLPPANFAASAPGSTSYDVPYLLNSVLGLRIKIIAGYPGSRAGGLAVDRQEVDGVASALSSVSATQPEWIKHKKVRFLVQVGRIVRHPDFPDVPMARELAPNDEALALIKLQEAPLFMARPYAAPGGLPPDAAKILKAAFMATAKDPKFVDAGNRLKIDVSPIDGNEVQELLRDLSKIPSAVFAKYKAIMESRPTLSMVKHTGKVTATEDDGRSISLDYKGKTVTAKVSGSRTKITVGGKAAKRKSVKVGMTCTFTYMRAGAEAKSVDCKG